MQLSGWHSFAGTQSESETQSSRPACVAFLVTVGIGEVRVMNVVAVVVTGSDVTGVAAAVEVISFEGTGKTGEVFEVHPDTTANAMQNNRINLPEAVRRGMISLFMPQGLKNSRQDIPTCLVLHLHNIV
jgi:hypothetical protein